MKPEQNRRNAVILVCAALAALEAFAMASTSSLTLHVSPRGNDAGTGKSAAPFATFERARDEVRRLRQSGQVPMGGVSVEIAGGTYELDRPLELTPEDSGTPDAPIVYRAKDGETVRVSGGRRVASFQPANSAHALDRLSPQAREHVVQADLRAIGVTDYGVVSGSGLELFWNDEPMTLARWPNEGFVRIADLVGGHPVDVRGTKGDLHGDFMYEGDRPSSWIGENDPWVHGYWFWDWSDQRHAVASIDPEGRIISVKPPYHGYGYRKGQWFYGLNLLSELDSPGEWYVDREEGILYFWAPSPVESGTAVVSVIDALVTMTDVSHVTLSRLTFEAARGTAITIFGGSDVRVSGCTLRNLGSWAVTVRDGERHVVAGCDIYQTGNGGVSLSGGDRPTLTPANHVARNNHIHHYSRWNRMYQPAIAISGVGNRADHNLIHNAPHMAIMFSGNDHAIEYNEIHSVCYESNDAGAIYSGRDWTMRGTVIRHNYLHDITGFEGKGCVGVYLDDMFCGTEISGNLFYRVTRAAFIGGGRDCTVENNIFVDCSPSLHIDGRAMGWASYHVGTTMTDRLNDMPYKNALWSSRYPELVNILDQEPAAPNGNVVRLNISVGGKWDEIYDNVRDRVRFEDNLVDVDPEFVGAPPSTFELNPHSPAFGLGFQQIPESEIGIYNDSERASWPPVHLVRKHVQSALRKH